MKSIKAIFRRGQNPKADGQNLPDNLSRTSSVTNLDADQKANSKGAKPRKSASRDRIDKIGEAKKHDKKVVTKNNNKLESGDSPYPSIDSLQEEEFLQLRRQLQEMAQEKSNLALQLGEQKGQLNLLQKEIQKLKEESNLQLEHLTEENTVLRNRLRDVAHSPLSDYEKQQLLNESHRHHSSAPASIATNSFLQLADEGNGGDITACPTPDWDKHSSSNVSEVSVACLQDKINQMQETHYSTNEELQATLQELTDLQRQLTELQQENERLNEEKTLMFDSLCRQTERLNDSRSEVESLKQLLYREKDETGQYESAVEREQKLLELLKSAQEEREAMLAKLEQVNNDVQETRSSILEKDERISQLSERVRTLESTLDAKHAEHKQLDQELAQAKDQCSARQIEINRLTDLLDNARTKITELEQDRALSDKSELDELLDNARKEKDALESEVAHLKEQLAISKNEIEKLKEQISMLQEECKVIRNNARTTQSDLEYKCEKLVKEKTALGDQLQEFQEAVNELQVQSQCQLEDKRQLSAVLSETQRNLSEAERKNLILENEVQELKKLRSEENDEWEKFQNDLLTSVRVANDFKTEAQQELQRMILENKSYRDRERQLKAEIDKLKGDDVKKEESQSRSRLSDKENIPKEMDLFKFPRKHRSTPRKSKETIDTLSSSSKSDKSKEKKPDALTKMVKRRERRPAAANKTKTLSVEEELLLKSLNDWYENIDKNIPEDKLTEEQKVVKKLKTLYEDEGVKEKPVAHKPKDQLAISKPLLDSVFLNPKLEEIAKDPSVPTIEEIGKSDVLSYHNESPELRRSPGNVDRGSRVKSDNFGLVDKERRVSPLGRSKSVDDLYGLDENNEKTLYRTNQTDDLRNEITLKRAERESSILPSDSVSNPRYSDFTLVVNFEKEPTKEQPRTTKTKPVRKSSVNHATLDRIVSSIPKNTPDSQLNSEQKFALRLKRALDEAERKNTLKKQKRSKKLVISSPSIESVKKNPALRDILLDPDIKSVTRRNSHDQTEAVTPSFNETLRQSKSYQDICFTFQVDPNQRTVSTHSRASTNEDNRTSGMEELSSKESVFSEQIHLEERGDEVIDVKVSVDFTPVDKTDSVDLKANETEEFDSLTYNETLTKAHALKKNIEHPKGARKASSTTSSNKDDHQDFDLLYNERKGHQSVETAHESKPHAIIKIIKYQTVDPDSDLTYNETLNKKITNINKDKDLHQGPLKSDTDYQTKTDELPIETPSYQGTDLFPLEKKSIEETVTKNKDVSRNMEIRNFVPMIQPRNKNIAHPTLTAKEEIYDKMQTAVEVPADDVTFEDAEYQKKIKLPNLIAKEEVYDKMQIAVEIGADSITLEDAEYQEKIKLPNLTAKKEVYDKMQTAVEVPADGITFEDTEYQEKIKLPNLTAKEEVYDKMQTAVKVPADGITFEDAEYQEKIKLPNLTLKEEIYDKIQAAVEVDADSITLEDIEDQEKLQVQNLTAKEEVYDRMQTAVEVRADGITLKDIEYHLSVVKDRSSDVSDIIEESNAEVLETQFSDMPESHTKINDNFSKCLIDVSTDITDNDVSAEESDEYNYQSILKENRFGVTSPLNVRLVYKDVVREIKHKFPQDEDEKDDDRDDDDDEDVNDGLEQNDFFDDFFGVKRKGDLQSVTTKGITDNVDNIDREMEEIFEKYLHTPLSKVITQIEDRVEDKTETSKQLETYQEKDMNSEDEKLHLITSENLAEETLNDIHSHVTNLEENVDIKNENVSDLTEKLKDEENDAQSVEEIMLIIDDSQGQAELEEQGIDRVNSDDLPEEIANDSLKDANEIDHIKGREYPKVSENIPVDQISNDSLTDCAEQQLPDVVESINKHVAYEKPEDDLTLDEINLLRTAREHRYSRPLSDFGEQDLLLVQAISARYVPDNQMPAIYKPDVQNNKAEQEEKDFPSSPIFEKSSEMTSNDVMDSKKLEKETKLYELSAKKQDYEQIPEATELQRPKKSENSTARGVDTEKKLENIPIGEINIQERNKTRGDSVNKNEDGKSKEATDLDEILTKMLVPKRAPRRFGKYRSSKDTPIKEQHRFEHVKDASPNFGIAYEAKYPDEHEVFVQSKADVGKDKNDVAVTVKEIDRRETSDVPNTSSLAFSMVEDNTTPINNEENGDKEKEADKNQPEGNEGQKESADSEFIDVQNQILEQSILERRDTFLAKPVIIDYQTVKVTSDDHGFATIKGYQEIEIYQDCLELNYAKSDESGKPGQKIFSAKVDEENGEIIEENVLPQELCFDKQGKTWKPAVGTSTIKCIVSEDKDSGERQCKKYEKCDSHADRILKRTTTPENVLLKSNKYTPHRDINDLFQPIRTGNLRDYKYGTKDLFNRDYKGVKERLEFFSKSNESRPSSRQSLRSSPGRSTSDERKVKSWAESFERRSLDTHSYEPVYANFNTLMAAKNTPVVKTRIEKKPLPVPRSKSHSRPSSVDLTDTPQSVVNDDKDINEIKMNDPENFSEHVAKDILQEVAAKVFPEDTRSESLDVRPDTPGNHEVPKFLLGAANSPENEGELKTGHTIGIKKSEKFLDVPIEDEIKKGEDDHVNLASGAESSFSAIAVAGKFEQLDITKRSDNDLEEMDNNNQSKLNLFQIETPSYDESYLNLFKQPEDKVYEDITGQKKPQRGVFNIAYLGEASDNDSFEDFLNSRSHNIHIPGIDKSKPKIIDFVPLDDATKPVFKKNTLNVPDYDTLEREKTFQILSASPSDAKLTKRAPKMEGSKTSLTSGSSFSAAKKVFEALLEANSEKNTTKSKITKKRDSKESSLYDLKEKIELGRNNSSVGLVDKRKMEETMDKNMN